MKRKIFISLNIPPRAVKRLRAAISKWQNLPIKWTRNDNFHITLLFLGFLDEEVIPEICQKVRKATGEVEIFDIEFDKIEWFPSVSDPKLIALTGPANANLLELVEKIEKELGIFTVKRKTFRPHITLGRGRKYKWEALENKPSVSEKFPLIVTTDSTYVMASDFGDGEYSYGILESCPLK
jgi:RNA 2',3'-cyclic 3'-phosphodiesterase